MKSPIVFFARRRRTSGVAATLLAFAAELPRLMGNLRAVDFEKLCSRKVAGQLTATGTFGGRPLGLSLSNKEQAK